MRSAGVNLAATARLRNATANPVITLPKDAYLILTVGGADNAKEVIKKVYKPDKAEADPAIVVATTTANLRLNLEQIRLAQANAELKRFQLLKQLINIKVRRSGLGSDCLHSSFLTIIPCLLT